MANEWVETTLGDVLTLQRGFDLPETERLPGPYPVIASTGPVGSHSDAMVAGPGVVIGRSGSLGGGQFIHSDFWPLNTTLWVKDFKGNDRRFSYYLLKSLDLAHFNAGSGVPTLNRNHIHPLPVRVPADPGEQRSIASILGTLDDKIELNRRMNETLEAIARAIFKSWFVDFDPVRAKADGRQPYGMDAKTAALFPDAFEESPLGKIPKGWRAGQLDDLLLLQRGFDLPTAHRTRGRYAVVSAGGISGSHDESLVKGPGVVTGRSGMLGNVFLLLDDFWPLNTTLWVKEFRSAGPVFAYHLLRRFDLSVFNAGSAVPTLNRNHIHNLPTLVPPKDVVAEFEGLTVPLYKQRDSLVRQSATLAELRDGLLPKLLSGEVRVKDAERFVGRHA